MSDFLQKSTEFLEKHKKSEEPAIATATVVGSSSAVVMTAIIYFFPKATTTQLEAALVIVTFLMPIVTGFLTRFRVWSSASVNRLLWLKERDRNTK